MPGSGSYFSYADYKDVGGERIILFPGHYLYRARNILPTLRCGAMLVVAGGPCNTAMQRSSFCSKTGPPMRT